MADITATTRAREIIPVSQRILRRTGGTTSRFMDRNLLLGSTERMGSRGVKTTLDIAKKEQGVLFGSKAREFQLAQKYKIKGEVYKLDKVPRDIEVRFDFGRKGCERRGVY